MGADDDLQEQLVPSPRITHPNLPKGKELVTLYLNFRQPLQPPLVLPRRGDTGYSEPDKPMTIKQSSVSVPPLRGRLGGG